MGDEKLIAEVARRKKRRMKRLQEQMRLEKRTALTCAARGCDGCLVCMPANVIVEGRPAALSPGVPCNDGLAGTVPQAPTFDKEKTAMQHELKTDHEVFQAMIDGGKTYELRKDDRGYQVGDTLTLRETRYTGEEMAEMRLPLEYTGRTTGKVVTHILRGPIYGLTEGWAILSCK